MIYTSTPLPSADKFNPFNLPQPLSTPLPSADKFNLPQPLQPPSPPLL